MIFPPPINLSSLHTRTSFLCSKSWQPPCKGCLRTTDPTAVTAAGAVAGAAAGAVVGAAEGGTDSNLLIRLVSNPFVLHVHS